MRDTRQHKPHDSPHDSPHGAPRPAVSTPIHTPSRETVRVWPVSPDPFNVILGALTVATRHGSFEVEPAERCEIARRWRIGCGIDLSLPTPVRPGTLLRLAGKGEPMVLAYRCGAHNPKLLYSDDVLVRVLEEADPYLGGALAMAIRWVTIMIRSAAAYPPQAVLALLCASLGADGARTYDNDYLYDRPDGIMTGT